ncbi:hypothetical protein SBA4_7450005 [Candidatus Sulfopaludibacter sp. SbA4]|nr:hypothetical protein SBA4_7450005 [Candidatus Sulfopaludibacter sp. SbA4]
MDVERTMEFILDQLAQIAVMHAQAEAEAKERAAQHDHAIAEHDRAFERHDGAMERHERAMERIDKRLDRAVRLGVREFRNERRRRQEMDARWDEKMTQLAAAQLLTEEKHQLLEVRLESLGNKLDGFIDALRRGGNGGH